MNLSEIKDAITVDEEALWTSREMNREFTDMAKAVLDRYGSDFGIQISIIFSKEDAIAWTSFRNITINAGHSVVQKIVKRSNRLRYMKGLLAHELSHIIYMDKDMSERHTRMMEKGMFFPHFPQCSNERAQEIKETLKDNYKAAQLARIASNIVNCLEDGYGENTYLANYYGSLADGMQYMRKEFYNDMIPVVELEKKLFESTPEGTFSAIMSVILQYSLYQEIRNGSKPLVDEVVEMVKPFIDKMFKQNFKHRLNTANELIADLWPMIEPLLKSKEEDKQGNNSNDQGGDNKEQKPENQGEHGSPKPNKPKGNVKPAEGGNKPEQTHSPGNSSGNGGKGQSSDDKDMEDILNNIIDDIKQRMAEEMAEEQIKRQANMEANRGTAKGCKVLVTRDTSITDDMIREYEKYSDVLEISRRIQKSIKQQLDDRRKGGKRTNLYMGRKIETRNIIRNDGKCFYNNKLPQDVPRIVVAMIVDESGSMDGNCGNGKTRIENAKTTAIVVEDFCSNLDFPIMIIGSTADYTKRGASELELYSSFNCVDNKDRYRLTQIKSKECNRDGAALAYVYDEMVKRPEEIKIIFTISDGKPNALGYGGEYAISELKEIYSKCIKSGMIVFAAAVGEDKQKIEGIYGDSFLDISDMECLPKIFVDRIKRFIKR